MILKKSAALFALTLARGLIAFAVTCVFAAM